jgi:hypothetical protein
MESSWVRSVWRHFGTGSEVSWPVRHWSRSVFRHFGFSAEVSPDTWHWYRNVGPKCLGAEVSGNPRVRRSLTSSKILQFEVLIKEFKNFVRCKVWGFREVQEGRKVSDVWAVREVHGVRKVWGLRCPRAKSEEFKKFAKSKVSRSPKEVQEVMKVHGVHQVHGVRQSEKFTPSLRSWYNYVIDFPHTYNISSIFFSCFPIYRIILLYGSLQSECFKSLNHGKIIRHYLRFTMFWGGIMLWAEVSTVIAGGRICRGVKGTNAA